MRILEINDKPENAISFYRSRMPFNDLLKEVDDLIVDVFKSTGLEFGWDVYKYDILFFSNPLVAKHLEIIKTAKTYGVKIWIDYDDCYFDIPKDSTSYSILNVGHIGQTVRDCLRLANVVTVTTNYLKEQCSPYSNNIIVIPNAFPLQFLEEDGALGKPELAIHKFVTWRGSDSHRANLESFKDELKEVADNSPEWQFKFFGCNPWWFDNKFKYSHYGFEKCFDAFYKLKMFSSKIHIVPLNDRPFTRSKSNIAWVEATIAGSVVLAPNWEEWQKPGIVNYDGKQDFKEKLQALINGEYDFSSHFEESKRYIENNLSLKKINRDRIKILLSL